MKTLFSNLFVVTLFVCLSADYAYSLTCYECDNFDIKGGILYGNENSPCTDVDPSMLRLCRGDDEDSVCRTLRGDYKPLKDGNTYTIIQRSCGKLKVENVKEWSTGKQTGFFLDGVAVSSMVCNTDLCNGAMGITSTKTFLFLCSMLSVFSFTFVY